MHEGRRLGGEVRSFGAAVRGASRPALRRFAIGAAALALASCASLPPGADYPKGGSAPLPSADSTVLGRQFDVSGKRHRGQSAFHIVAHGVDGLRIRLQMIRAAERTLDLQYFIFRGDESGRMLTDEVLKAADRGVSVRILVDDGDTVEGDDQIVTLEAHRSVSVRIFNPFRYRGHLQAVRAMEFALNAPRLDFRMHNKLMVVDNAAAVIGGRNVGDEYFQIDRETRFADDDVFAAGPIVPRLSATFEEYWNSALAIPAQALYRTRTSPQALQVNRMALRDARADETRTAEPVAKKLDTDDPFAGIVSGRLPVTWANAEPVSDSPDKKKVVEGIAAGRLMERQVARAASEARTELLMVSPYLVPGTDGMRLLESLRARSVSVRILTNSLESTTEMPAQAAYMHYRIPMLEKGVVLYEIRSAPLPTGGRDKAAAITHDGRNSLHAKMIVIDRRKLYLGSMNFDQRSMHINTEIGLLIDSPELAGQLAKRFEAMVRPENAYRPVLGTGRGGALQWLARTEAGDVVYDTEPAPTAWRRVKAHFLSLLPIDPEM